MSKPVRFAREAREEALAAARWYHQQRPGLGAEFLASLDEAVERLERIGSSLAVLPGSEPDAPIRRVHLTRFPYSVVYIELPTRLRVLAVQHGRRRPGYWRDRVRR
jgi:toxin ParE1/3/4